MAEQKLSWRLMVIAIIILALTGVAYADASKTLLMATTTSTDNTGLLDELGPKFTAATGIDIKWTATGTGKALKLGENCDVDILMVHAPDAEMAFVRKGFGTDRTQIMYNDFVIIGPRADPAGVKGKSVKEALLKITSKKAVMVSRGDNSGTHMKELSLWKSARLAVPDKAKWYVQTGQGMLATINVAAERMGYTMTDRATYIKYAHTQGGNPPLVILVEGDQTLVNQYSVIAIDTKHCDNAKYDLAKQFIDWIAGPDAQQAIKDFKLLGKTLFIPNAN